MYRILRALDLDGQIIKKGTISTLSELHAGAIQKLLDRGLIATVATPPLAILPDWGGRAARLDPIGVTTIEQFLKTDDRDLAQALKVGAAKVDALKNELRTFLIAPRGKDITGI